MSEQKFSVKEIAEMIDLSAVKAEQSEEEFQLLINTAKEHQIKCVFVLPSHTKRIVQALSDEPDILVGGVVGFPSGGSTTTSKIFECQELINLGCDEIDMVMNIGLLKAKRYDEFVLDIKSVVECAESIPVKVILECHHLTDEEITKACELAVNCGVDYVKTGTGWAPTGATSENVALMSKAVAGRCKIKAAGGVRDLETLLELNKLGATRFGLGVATALDIINNTANAGKGAY